MVVVPGKVRHMPVLSSNDQFLDVVAKSNLVEAGRLQTYLHELGAGPELPLDPRRLAARFVRDGLLTKLQAEQLLQGKHKGFIISGKYKVLELLGVGGMGKVFLCEHMLMRRLLAIKVLPVDNTTADTSAIERFYREARAVGSLNHPNIVWAHDIDRDDKMHFLAMEYVDGTNLHEIVERHGPMDVRRAAHYIAQAANGLQHAHEAGWVHRDIKPGNLLLDRGGFIKILDMGLARLFDDNNDALTQKYDQNNVLGTADFLAPEQALDSHDADIRADIYGLGATFYFLLTGRPPFPECNIAQKLIYHQTQEPAPVRDTRPDVPEALQAVLRKMMAKERADRYQTPVAVAQALAPWTAEPIELPPAHEMPRLSPAVLRLCQAGANTGGPNGGYVGGATRPSGSPSSAPGLLAHSPSSSLRATAPALDLMDTKIGVPAGSATLPGPTPSRMPVASPTAPPTQNWITRRWVIGAIAAAIVSAGVSLAAWTAFRTSAAEQVEPRPQEQVESSSMR